MKAHHISSEIELKTSDLFNSLVPFLFSFYDRYLPNDSFAWETKTIRILDTPLPNYNISVDGVKITVQCNDLQLNGSPTTFVALIGRLWGIARGKILGETACARLLYEVGVSMPDGDYLIERCVENFLDQYVALMSELKKADGAAENEEAELLLYQILQNITIGYQLKDKYPLLGERLVKLFSPDMVKEFSGHPRIPNTEATTHQAVIKKLAQSDYLTSDRTVHKIILLEILHGHIYSTDSNFLRVLKIFQTFLPLLEDRHPWVRYLMWETMDMIASKLFYYHAYEHMLPILDRLIENGMNLDINVARRFECRLALDDEKAAQEDWKRLQQIVKPWEPAPAQHSGFHTTYPNYHFWQLFSYLRIAEAHIKWGQGSDPCKYVIKRKGKIPPKEFSEKHFQAANNYISVVAEKMPQFIRDNNAFEVGKIFAELQVELGKLMRKDLYQEQSKNFVMHLDYVQHLLTQRPLNIQTIKMLKCGLFKRIEGRHFEFMEETTSIHSAERGFAFGIEYFVEGEPLSHIVSTVFQVYYRSLEAPPESKVSIGEYKAVSYVGQKNAFYWSFDTEEDKKAGVWSIEIRVENPNEKLPFLQMDFTIQH